MLTNVEKLLDKDSLEKYKLYNEITERINQIKEKNEIKLINEEGITFKEGKILKLADDFIYKKGEKEDLFYKGSKIMFFINAKKSKDMMAFFIHDEASLNDALKATEIEDGLLKNKEDYIKRKENYDSNKTGKSDDSSNSAISMNGLDIYKILNSNYDLIMEPTAIMIEKIFKEENFSKRFKNTNTISSLDFNFKYLKGEVSLESNIEFIEENYDWPNQIRKISEANKSYNYIFGPKGIGKTTNLLKYLNFTRIPRLYFSLKILNDIGFIKKWKKYALRETLYIFDSLEEMTKFSEENINDNCNYLNLMEFILSYIKLIVNFYSKNKIIRRNKIIIIIDDYNEQQYDKNNFIEKIIDYVNENKNKLRLFILGDGKYMNAKLCQYYSEEDKDFEALYWNLSIENEISKKNKILKIPKYYFKYKNSTNLNKEESIVKQIITREFNELKLNSFLFLSKYIDSFIDIQYYKDEIVKLPLEYLTIEIKKEDKKNKIKFTFNSELYIDVFDEAIKGKLKLESLINKSIIFKDEDEKGKNGTDFEDIIIEQLWNNTIEYIQFPENNKLKVYDIYALKYYTKEEEKEKKVPKGEKKKKDDENQQNIILKGKKKFETQLKMDLDKKRKNINIEEPIIIKQYNFSGKFYDLLLILTKGYIRYAIFIQIGLNKTGKDINTYFNNLCFYEEEYKKGLSDFIGHQIDEIGFLLIFEDQHQKEVLVSVKNNEGILYCKSKKIDYLIYKNFQLYKEVNDLSPIISFDVRENALISGIELPEGYEISSIIDSISKVYEDLASNKNNIKLEPKFPIKNKEKSAILNFIKDNYNIEYEDLNYGLTILDEKKEINEYGLINSNIFNHINVFINKTEKYFCYNNQTYKIAGENIEKVEVKAKKDKDEFNWDVYFLRKKRNLKKND